MCGIAGIVASTPGAFDGDKYEDVCREMLAALRHRGPDNESVFCGEHFVLGHARLSIIDLQGGDQPLHSIDDRYHLIANGEIYNHRELREAFKATYRFTTESDCEAISAAYDAGGVEGFRKLNGMFAFMLADSDRRSVICAVDPVGIKPLYFFRYDSVVLVASELKALVVGMRAIGAPVYLSESTALAYLRDGWSDVRRSIVAGVERLGPGECLTISSAGTNAVRRYQDMQSLVGDHQGVVPDLAELEESLRAAVRRQLIADVPVGFFLSGGVDSSLLVAMARQLDVDVNTFTVDFSGDLEADSVSEARYARLVADQLGCNHHEMKFDATTLVDRLDRVFDLLDEPLADPAVVPLSVISEFARSEVKVCVSGDGGDEIFAGYLRHAINPLRRRIHQVPGLARCVRAVGAGVAGVQKRIGGVAPLRKIAMAFDMVGADCFTYGPFAGANSRWLVDPVRCPEIDQHIATSLFELELEGPLPGQMLSKVDRASMSQSLEVRVPFLDLEFLKIALRYPPDRMRKGRLGKMPLRSLLAGVLPETISQRPKHGFRVPLSAWIRTEMKERIEERLLDSRAIPSTLISRDSVEQLLGEHRDGTGEHSVRIWALLSLAESIGRLGIKDVR